MIDENVSRRLSRRGLAVPSREGRPPTQPFRPHLKALVGLALTASIVVASVLAPWIAPHDPYAQTIERRLLPPAFQRGGSLGHLLGTDALGRDIFSRILWGSRVSLMVGLTSVVIAGSLGTTLGLVTGYYGGRIDAVLMRLLDVQLALPFLVLALMIVAIFGGGLVKVILILGLTGWVVYARIARGEVLTVKTREFIDAARALGVPSSLILRRHILPNIVHSVIVIAALEVGSMILAEASLSFLGLGVQPPTPSWGGMVADGRDYLATAWWVSTMPGVAIVLTVLGVTLLGDWVRDMMDPRQRWTFVRTL